MKFSYPHKYFTANDYIFPNDILLLLSLPNIYINDEISSDDGVKSYYNNWQLPIFMAWYAFFINMLTYYWPSNRFWDFGDFYDINKDDE